MLRTIVLYILVLYCAQSADLQDYKIYTAHEAVYFY